MLSCKVRLCWCIGTVLARCHSGHCQWLTWMPAGIEPRCAGWWSPTPFPLNHWATTALFPTYEAVMWSETVVLGQDQSETKSGLGLASCGLGLAYCSLGLGLAVLVLFCETWSCNARRHNDLEEHNNFSSIIYSFSILCLEHQRDVHETFLAEAEAFWRETEARPRRLSTCPRRDRDRGV